MFLSFSDVTCTYIHYCFVLAIWILPVSSGKLS